MAETNQHKTKDDVLRKAYQELLEQFRRNDLAYWKDKLFAVALESEERHPEDRSETRALQIRLQFQSPPGLKRDRLDDKDDDQDGLLAAKKDSVRKKTKREVMQAMSPPKPKALYRDDGYRRST